jgi:hypothetical protein
MSIQFEKTNNIEEIRSKLISMGRISQEFHRKYIEPLRFSDEINSVRAAYVDKLDEIVRIQIFLFSVPNSTSTKGPSKY